MSEAQPTPPTDHRPSPLVCCICGAMLKAGEPATQYVLEDGFVFLLCAVHGPLMVRVRGAEVQTGTVGEA